MPLAKLWHPQASAVRLALSALEARMSHLKLLLHLEPPQPPQQPQQPYCPSASQPSQRSEHPDEKQAIPEEVMEIGTERAEEAEGVDRAGFADSSRGKMAHFSSELFA